MVGGRGRPLSILATDCHTFVRFVTESPVERVPRRAVSRATRSAAWRRGTPARDELGDGARLPASSSGPVPAPGAEHERDLALRRLRERAPRPRRPCRARPPRTASSARGRRRPAAPGSAAASERSVAGSRCGDSNATAGHGQPAQLLPERRAAPLAAAAGSRGTGSAPPTKPLATSAVSTADGARQHGHRHARLERRRDQPRARVVDPGQAGVGDERDPLARLRAAAAARPCAPPRCARGS